MSPDMPSGSPAIRVEGLGKRYRIGAKESAPETLAGAVAGWFRAPLENLRSLRRLSRFGDDETGDDVVWALRDVSFEVNRGEVVGVIGRNGAGKSTLLKILTRITEPTEGRAEIHGQVASLLEVGTGFHQELTGRENVYLNGAVLGMSKTEIDAKFDEIVAFSGVEKFLDTPIKRYSSGMKVRLAFAVAANLEAEILLIDEVLAVGDAEFQKRCLGKMESVAHSGRTVIFVSHDMAAVSHLCQRSIYLRDGCIAGEGETESIVRTYIQDSEAKASQTDLAKRLDRGGDGRARFTGFQIIDLASGQACPSMLSGKDYVLRSHYRAESGIRLDNPQISLKIHTSRGTFVTVLTNWLTGEPLQVMEAEGYIDCHLPQCPFMEGRYHVELVLIAGGSVVDLVRDAATIDVEAGDFFGTGRHSAQGRQGVFLRHNWRTVSTSQT